jgi:hypothetical protein
MYDESEHQLILMIDECYMMRLLMCMFSFSLLCPTIRCSMLLLHVVGIPPVFSTALLFMFYLYQPSIFLVPVSI